MHGSIVMTIWQWKGRTFLRKLQHGMVNILLAPFNQDQDHFISKFGGQQASFQVWGLQIYPRQHVCYWHALSIYCGTSYVYFQRIKKTFFSLTDLTTSTTASLSQAFCYFFPSFWKKQKYICKYSFCTEAQTFLTMPLYKIWFKT
jgi:hypothetical protein